MPLDVLIEGFLFYKSAPQQKSFLIKLFDISSEEFVIALAVLKNRLESGATRLLETMDQVQLVTAPLMVPVIHVIRKNEMKADISKAGSETLAIILYREPVSRADIDRIRGVNSAFILRNLLIRGLVERNYNKMRGAYEFVISPELLSHLGITTKLELPDFSAVANAVEKFNANLEEEKS